MQMKSVTFQNANGQKLSARLDLPSHGEPTAFALFAHCFTCNKNYKAVYHVTRSLVEEGIGVLRFDFTGLGESEGEFADTTFSSNVEDLVAAAEFLAQEHAAPKLLIGHSLGGAAVIHAGARLESVEAVVTIAAPCKPDHVTKHLQSSVEEIRENGVAEVKIAGRPFKVKKQFLDDLSEKSMDNMIEQLGKPLLIFHSPTDSIVDYENAQHLYEHAQEPRSLFSLGDADHLLSKREDAKYVGKVIAAWLPRFVELDGAVKHVPGEEGRTVVWIGEERYRTEIVAEGKHFMLADEPKEMNGADLGSTPYGFLLASLGSCTAITLRMYADHKELPLESVKVSLKHEKVHAEDCSDCESEKGKVDVITREITLTGDLSDDQRQRLLQIADKCPVHKTLHNEIVVRSSLTES